ncbi:GGDEF domain-containing protein [Lacimicrobium sp. SS2-24]|uniref:GGDEF domain-containing protein n=1 Tax=Lacimicrobium sp. SS2-24 TaxID=2005569 RepID=UPI00143AE783|nr:GGDEF domain-containing protein [Lacimicrobium sp. SS2-24]
MDTLLVVGIASALIINLLVSGFMLAVYFYHQREQAFLIWALACGCFVAGSGLLITNQHMAFYQPTAGYTLLVLSAYFLLRGAASLADKAIGWQGAEASLPVFIVVALSIALAPQVGLEQGGLAAMMMALAFILTERTLAKGYTYGGSVMVLLRALMIMHAVVMAAQAITHFGVRFPGAEVVGSQPLLVFSHLVLTVATALTLPMLHAIRVKQRWQDLANTDALTSALNRRGFFDRAQALLKTAPLKSCSFLMIDIDHFKKINDRHGHAIGDVVLQQVAQRVYGNIRKTDLLGRLGGEEFGVLMPDTPQELAQSIARRLLRDISSTPFNNQGKPIDVTISIGATSNITTQTDLELCLRQADRALYQAKSMGRNRLRFAGPLT